MLSEFLEITEFGKRPNYSIADALNRYIEEELPKLRSRRDSDIRAIREFTVGKALEEIPEAAQAYRAAHPDLSPASRNRRCHVLRRVANLAYRWGWLDKPLYVPMEPERNARHVYLTVRQIKAVIAACENEHAQAFLTIAAFTGMRRGEIMALAKSDLGRDYITVRHSKTGRPRQVPIVPAIRQALKHVPFEYHKDTFSDMASAAGKTAGYPGFRLHDLRHSTASLLLNDGVSLEIVGQILGHESLQTTRRYAHLAPAVAREALLRATRKRG